METYMMKFERIFPHSLVEKSQFSIMKCINDSVCKWMDVIALAVSLQI